MNVNIDRQNSPSKRVHEDAFRNFRPNSGQGDQKGFCITVGHTCERRERCGTETAPQDRDDIHDLA